MFTAEGARTVLVDMDGVLADYEEPNNAVIRAHFPGVTALAERQDFYFADSYHNYPEICLKLDEEIRRPGFFASFPLVEGALEGWERIMKAGYTPRVCSSPIENHPSVVDEKREWLKQHFAAKFGMWVVDTAIFDRDKSGYDAFAVIDDRPTLRNSQRATWQHIIFSHSYNASVQTNYRLDHWRDPSLEALLARAQVQYAVALRQQQQ